MNENRVKAAKARWAKVDPEVRKKHATHAVTCYWSNKTPEEKRERAMKMVLGRKLKANKKIQNESKI